jgi:hypothetical protein
MKHLLLTCFLIFFSLPLMAQDSSDEITLDLPAENQTATQAPAAKTRRLENWVFGGAVMQWSEEMRFRQAGATRRSVANFNGAILQASKEFTYYRVGWSLGAFVGSGKANGDSPGLYEEGNLVFSVLGAQTRAFYRLNGRVNFGLSFMIFNRNLAWPELNGVSAESGKNPNINGVADLNVRLFKNWDFYQGIGPMAEGTTLWKIGLNYRY